MQRVIGTFLSIVIISSLFSLVNCSTRLSDPCQITEKVLFRPTEISSCFDSLDYDQDRATKTIDTLQQIVSQYIFKDISKDSGPPFNIQIDLDEELGQIAKTKYDNDFLMHQAINNVFKKLYDAHTMYHKPWCYSAMFFFKPFQIYAVQSPDGNDPIVKIKGPTLTDDWFIQQYKSAYGYDLNSYQDKVIKTIDSIPAWKYITEESQDVWASKDINARLNEYLFFDFHEMPLAYENIPDEFVELGIENEKTTKFPIVGYSMFSYTNSSEFHKNCLKGVLSTTRDFQKNIIRENANSKNLLPPKRILHEKLLTSLSATKQHDDQEEIPETQLKYSSQTETETKTKTKTVTEAKTETEIENRIENKINSGELITIFQKKYGISFKIYNETNLKSNSETLHGIIRIYNFAPDNVQGFKYQIEQIYDYLYQHDVEYLVIDLRNNGGGIIDLGYQLFYYIFGTEEYPDPKIGNYDFRHSDLHDEMFSKCELNEECLNEKDNFFSPKYWLDANEKEFESNIWYFQGNNYTRGEKIHGYSSLVHEPVDLSWENTNELYYKPEKVLVLSDGRCGSTCAVFAAKILENELAKTVTIGGKNDLSVKVSPISFPGGEVEDNMFFLYQNYLFSSYGITLKTIFPNFYSDQQLTFAWREIYSMNNVGNGKKDKNVIKNEEILPLEFTFLPSDYRILIWDLENDDAIIPETISYFNYVPTPIPTPTPTHQINHKENAEPISKHYYILFISGVLTAILILLLIIIVFIVKLRKQSKSKTTHKLIFDVDGENEDGFGFSLETSSDSFQEKNDDELSQIDNESQ
ncbi:peptidase s41 family protein [Anaeramoeba flamelloides]|uniref:Peptidase s41 family protein n=1 Tax=Anaeramoeba flamelloides TaxID=1746091 RepID=A0ABQ8Y8K1_9EUKA|nr:peptidase s41 family protein [Anaeramoeba flamelloides]